MKSIQETLELLRQTGTDFAQLVAFAEKWKYLMNQAPGAVATRKGSKYPWKVPAGQAPKKEKATKPTVKAPAKSKASPKKPKHDMIADALQVAFDHIKEYHPDVTHDDFMEALGRMSGKKNAPAKKEAKPKEEAKPHPDILQKLQETWEKASDPDLPNQVIDDATNLLSGLSKDEAIKVAKDFGNEMPMRSKKEAIDYVSKKIRRRREYAVIQDWGQDGSKLNEIKLQPKSEGKTIKSLLQEANDKFGLKLVNNRKPGEDTDLYDLAAADTRLLDKTYGKLGLSSNEMLRTLNDVYNKYKNSGGVPEQKIKNSIDVLNESIDEIVSKAKEHGENNIADFYDTIGRRAVKITGKHMLDNFARKPGSTGPIENPKVISDSESTESEPAQPNEHIESLANQLTFSPHQDGVSKRLDHVYDAMQASAKMHGGTAPTTSQFHQMLTDAQKNGGLELHVLNEVADLTPEQRKAMPTQGDNVLGFAIIKDKAKVNQAIEGVMSGKKLSKLDKKSKK